MPTHSLSLEGCNGPNSIATGDINGDGYRDVVVSCAEGKNLAVFLGRPGNTFTRTNLPTAGGWGTVAVADLNGDGRDDLIQANNSNESITIYLSK